MYGRYTKDLGEYAKSEARKLKMLERRRKQEDKARDRVSEFVLAWTSTNCAKPRNYLANVMEKWSSFSSGFGAIRSPDSEKIG